MGDALCYWCKGHHHPTQCRRRMTINEACEYLGPIRCWRAKKYVGGKNNRWWLDGEIVNYKKVLRTAGLLRLERHSRLTADQPEGTETQ